MTLYHYTSGNGLFGIINSSELHCSHQQFLNDPTEQSYFDNVLRSVLDKNEFLKTIYVELIIRDYLFDSSIQQFIFSLSKNPDSLSMWNYYANGNGYNIGFDIDSIIEKNDNRLKIKKVEMIYDFTKQRDLVKLFVENNIINYEKYNALTKQMIKTGDALKVDRFMREQTEIRKGFTQGINELKTSYKHAAYKDEEEIRLIINQSSNGQFKVSGQGVFIEYLTLGMTSDKDIIQIMAHPLSTELHVEGMKRFIKSKMTEKNVTVKKSEIPFRLI